MISRKEKVGGNSSKKLRIKKILNTIKLSKCWNSSDLNPQSKDSLAYWFSRQVLGTY